MIKALLLAILLIAAAACTSREELAAAAAADAEQAFAAGDYQRAAERMQDAIDQRDDVADYHILLGRTQLARREFGAAYGAFDRAIELDRGNTQLLSDLSQLLLLGGRLDQAEEYADKLLAIDPRDWRSILVKGYAALQRKRHVDASRFADEVLAIVPGEASAVALKGRAMVALGKPAEALALLGPLARDSDLEAVLRAMFEAYVALGDEAGMEAMAAKLAALQPGNTDVQIDYARQLYFNGRPSEASVIVAKLLTDRPQDAALQTLVVDLWREAGRATSPAAELARFGPEPPPAAIAALARFALAAGDPALAARLTEDAASGTVSADTADATMIHATALAGLKRVAPASQLTARVLAIDPTHPGALMLRARFALAARRYEPAVNDLQLVVRDNPDLVEARLLLGSALRARGEPVLADLALGSAMERLPTSPAMLAGYADHLVATGRGAQALRLAEQFTVANPDVTRGWYERGRLCVRLRREPCVAASLARLKAMRGGADPAGELTRIRSQAG